MLPHYLIEDFLAIIRERAETLYLPGDATLEEPDELADWLVHMGGFSPQQASDIANGDPDAYDWQEEDIYVVCESLHLDPELMEVLFQPTSKEGLVYTLDEHLAERPAHCEVCHELVQATRDADGIENAYRAALAYMGHVFVDDEDDDDEDETVLMAKQLFPAFFALPRSSQYRILSLIHQELEDSQTNVENPAAVLVEMREQMPANLIQLLDQAWSKDCSVTLESRDIARVEKFILYLQEQGLNNIPIRLQGDTLILERSQQALWNRLSQDQ
jgi:hypothetical protein